MYMALLVCIAFVGNQPSAAVAELAVLPQSAIERRAFAVDKQWPEAKRAFYRAGTRAPALLIAAQGRNSITGFVFDSSRRPVDHARIELLDDVDSVLASTLTNGSGRYGFYNIPSGTFHVRVLPQKDFAGQTVRVVITNFTLNRSGGPTTISGAQSEQVDFTLRTREEINVSRRPTVTGTTFAQNVPEAARAVYEKGVESLDKKNGIEQGIAELRKAIELFPTYYLALERLGVEYVKRQQYQPALVVLSKAVEVNPSGHISFYALGVAQFQLKRVPEAIESLKRSLSFAPDSPNAGFLHMYIGIALVKIGSPVEAENHFKQAHERGGKLVPDVHMHLAQMYSNNKRYAEAADELDMFLKEMPDARDSEMIKGIIKQLRSKAKKNSDGQSRLIDGQ